jgi:hypothetical protein
MSYAVVVLGLVAVPMTEQGLICPVLIEECMAIQYWGA